MAAAAWVMADAAPVRRGRKGLPRRTPAGPGHGAHFHAAAAAVALDRQPRRPAPARPDLPRMVGRRTPRPDRWSGGNAVNAREEVLARIRAANAAARPTPGEIPRDYRHTGAHPQGSAALIELLRDRLVDYRASVLDATPDSGPDGMPAAIATALADVTGPVLVPPGLPEDWCPEGVVDSGFGPAELDRFAAVVTGCAAACAETGTIALDASPDQGRRAITLVPDVHVCVVRAEQVVHSVPEAARHAHRRPAADLHQRTVGHERHRAGTRRGRARTPHPDRRPCSLRAVTPRWRAAHPPPRR